MKFHDTPLYTAEQIQRRVAELGAEISTAMAGREVLMLTVLKGAVLFGADLMRHLTVPLRIDFIGARSYCGTCSQGKVEFTYLPQEDCRGRHVLLVEDIIDTGRTAQATLDHLNAQNPAGVTLCTLLDKPSRREVPMQPDYTGFTIPDKFVVGYGLDYDQRGRELPEIRVLASCE